MKFLKIFSPIFNLLIFNKQLTIINNIHQAVKHL